MKLVFQILLKKLEFIITFFTWQKSWVCVFEKLAACFVRTPSSVPFCHFFLHLIFHYFSCTIILTFILFPVVFGHIGAFVWKGALLGQWESCLLVCQSLPYHPSSLCIHSLSKWPEPFLVSCYSQIVLWSFPLLSVCVFSWAWICQMPFFFPSVLLLQKCWC